MPSAAWMTVAALLLGLLAGCSHPATQAQMPAPKPPEVTVEMPVSAVITDYEDFTGRTMAQPQIEIRPHVTGYLDKIYFKEGADVKQGDMLYEIDPRPYQAEVDRAQGNLTQAEAHLKRLNADLQRGKTMLPNRTISPQDFDQMVGDQAEAEAAVSVAKANLDLAKQNLDYTKIRAKIDGRMSRTMLDAGNLVKVDETVLTTIVSLQPIFVTFGVDEHLLRRVHTYVEKGMLKPTQDGKVPVLMGLASEDGFPNQGYVNFIDNHLDLNTATLQVHGMFDNTQRRILPGLFARVRLPLGEPYQALTIPEQALGTDQGQKYVYVVNQENKVEYRSVDIGRLDGKRRVIHKGVAEGDRIVVSGLQRVRDGAVVSPKFAEATVKTDGAKSTGTIQTAIQTGGQNDGEKR
jgi:RND family efflux transporter MFP subunit